MDAVATDDLVIVSVVAKPGQAFAAYDLLQAISATRMKYGPMKIFHYYSSGADPQPLFSFTSINKPGYFDWDRLGEFTCTGLCLFMNVNSVNNPEEVFALMVATAEQLADDLDGELRGGQSLPWNDEVAEQIQTQLRKDFDLDLDVPISYD